MASVLLTSAEVAGAVAITAAASQVAAAAGRDARPIPGGAAELAKVSYPQVL
jgi:hypothetical protein